MRNRLNLYLRSTRIMVVVLVMLSAVLFIVPISRQDIMLKAEARMGLIVNHMIDSGDYLVPRLGDEVYLNKPPLFHWIVLLFSKMHGDVSEWMLRLPSALAAMGCLIVLFFFAGKVYDIQKARLACLILATNFMFLELAKFSRVDMLLCFFILVTCILLYQTYLHKKAGYFYISMAFLGLAFMTKGPVALLFVGIPGIILGILNKDIRFGLKGRHILLGLGIFLFIALPWYAMIFLKVPEAKEIFMRETIGRFGEDADHAKPFYYLPLHIFLDFMPWTVFAVWALFKVKKEYYRQKQFLNNAAIIVSVIIFLSLSRSKQGTYMLPIFPFLSMMASSILYEGVKSTQRLNLWKKLVYVPFWGMLIYCMIHTFFILPRWNEKHSYKPSAYVMNELIPEETRIVSYQFVPSIYEFYMKRNIEYCESKDELKAFLRRAPDCYAIIEKHIYEALIGEDSSFSSFGLVRRFRVRGGNIMYLLKTGEPR